MVVHCFDAAVARRYGVHGGAPVLQYSFGNRCDHHVDLDLAAVRVVGRDDAGREIALAPFDPRGEIHPQAIDARMAGSEQIEYPADRSIVSLCADVGGIDASAPLAERWVCMSGRPEVTR